MKVAPYFKVTLFQCNFKNEYLILIKGIVNFTRHQVVSNLFEFLSSAEHKGIYFEECR